MKYNKFSRRMFLQGSGAVLAIPFLESLAPSEARAQAAEPVKRYLGHQMNFDCGHSRNWLPKLTTLANPMEIPGTPQRGSFERLSSIMGSKPQLSPILNASMNPFISRMMIYKGLDIISHGVHDNGTLYYLGNMWSVGYGSLNIGEVAGHNPMTESIHSLIARNPKFDPAKRQVVHMREGAVAVRDALGNVVPKYSSGGWSALNIYNALFNSGAYPESGAAPISHPRRDLLTRVLGDYSRIINGRQIGTSDKIVLTSALDAIADLQRGLEVQVTNACRHRGFENNPNVTLGDLRLDDTLSWSNYIKLVVALFQCDITRAITIGAGPNNFEDWTGLPTQDYHGNVTHAPNFVSGGKENWQLMGELYGRHYRNFVAPLLTALDGCIDPANNKSFLNNGLAHLSVESNYPHRQINIPTVTIGDLNGTLPTGYMVNYTDPSRPLNRNGRDPLDQLSFSDNPAEATDQYTDRHTYDYYGIPYQRFLVTVLQAMGLSPSDYEDPTINQHVLNRSDSIYGAQNNGITNLGGYGVCSFEKISEVMKDGGLWYWHQERMKNYNWNYYKFPVPLPPKV